MSVLCVALLELASAYEAAAEALVEAAADQRDDPMRMLLKGKANGYTEAASDIRTTLNDYGNGEEE